MSDAWSQLFIGSLHGCGPPDRNQRIVQLLALSLGCLCHAENLPPMAVKQAAMRMASSAVRKVAYWAGGFRQSNSPLRNALATASEREWTCSFS
jgi:hypothetical protein